MDIWRSGILRAPLAEVLTAGRLDGFPVQWLPQDGRRFTAQADPFGIVRDGLTYIFVEALDYRNRRGRIDVLTFDSALEFKGRSTCLAEPWHLSYPVPIECDGETYLLPEAHRSGGLSLYRAVEFPERWERIALLDLPHVAVDATPLFHDGLWWLFYSPARTTPDELHVAFADRLTGPWRAHPGNPVRSGALGSRPGGTAIVVGDRILLPVQDGSRTYGGAIRTLAIDRLSTERFDSELLAKIEAPTSFTPFDQGLHTLSQCGPLTLFDVKRIDHSLAGRVVGLVGKARRAAG